MAVAERAPLVDVPAKVHARQALTSSASANWGSPEVVRQLSAAVLKPASNGPTAIDLDVATALYWQEQWRPEHRPAHFFDGNAPISNALEMQAWEHAVRILKMKTIGSSHCNPPGDPTGGLVQDFFAKLEAMRAISVLDSYFWVGFNLEQMRSLLPKQETPDGSADPIHPLDPRVCTVFPSSRISYLCTPQDMITILEAKIAKRDDKALRERLARLHDRSDDSPVAGPSPTHASFMTIRWSRDAKIKKAQQKALRSFLDGQRGLKRSPFAWAVCVGDVGA